MHGINAPLKSQEIARLFAQMCKGEMDRQAMTNEIVSRVVIKVGIVRLLLSLTWIRTACQGLPAFEHSTATA